HRARRLRRLPGMSANMSRVAAAAMMALVIAGSASAAYMRGTLTFDDGRTANLTVHRFHKGPCSTEGECGGIAASFQCKGDACFSAIGSFSLSGLVSEAPDGRWYYCDDQTPARGAGVCRIASQITCRFQDLSHPPTAPWVTVATGMLDVHRTTSHCRRLLRQS